MRWTGKRPRTPSTTRDGMGWAGITYSIRRLREVIGRGLGRALPSYHTSGSRGEEGTLPAVGLSPKRPEIIRDRPPGEGRPEVHGDQPHPALAHGARLGAGGRRIHHDPPSREREIDRPV